VNINSSNHGRVFTTKRFCGISMSTFAKYNWWYLDWMNFLTKLTVPRARLYFNLVFWRSSSEFHSTLTLIAKTLVFLLFSFIVFLFYLLLLFYFLSSERWNSIIEILSWSFSLFLHFSDSMLSTPVYVV